MRSDTRWWGWGNPGTATELPDNAMDLLADRGIRVGAVQRIPPLEEVSLESPREIPVAVIDTLGSGQVLTGPEARIRHSGGQAIADLLERRSGVISMVPDGILVPEDEEQIRSTLEACDREGVAVIPFGGGTSVVGGVRPERGEHRAVVSLDLAALRGFELDRASLTARFGAGLRGAEAEAILGKEGLTLGHFPQSFEYATIGGFAATRSAGQASTGYGRFDRMVTSVELISPAGTIKTPKSPHTAAGPSLKELILGSEGSLGVIPWVEVAVKEQPEARSWEAWLAPDFETGCELVREWQQGGPELSVVRVSDSQETAVSLASSLPTGILGRAVERYLGMRGLGEGSLIIAGLEGSRSDVRTVRNEIQRSLRSAGAASLGSGAGEAWARSRFQGPYLREALLDLGLVVETLETASSWSEHRSSYLEIKASIEATLTGLGMSSVVMCHLSHAYRDGASLYFTVIADSPGGDQASRWREVKAAALETITGLGLTVSHHHATGRDHAGFLHREAGEPGIAALKALKRQLDPRGIMNPGCLLLA